MKKTWRLIGLLLGTSFLIGRSQAEEFKYHPSLRPVLGKGMNLSLMDTSKEQCIDFTTNELPPGAQNVELSGSVSFSEEELISQLGIDMKAEASFLELESASGNSQMRLNTEIKNGEVAVVLRGESSFGSVSVLRAHLNPQSEQIIHANDMDGFQEKCGTHFVESLDYGVRFSIILRLRNVNHHERTQLNSSVAAGGSIGLLSGDVSTTLNSMIERRKQGGALDIQVVAMGGDGISDLTPLVRQMGILKEPNLQGLLDGIAAISAKLDRTHGAVLSFRIAPMTRFGYRAELQDFVIAEKYASLGELLKIIRIVNRGIGAIEKEILYSHTGAPSRLGSYYSAAVLGNAAAKRYRSQLIDHHRGCLSETSPEIQRCRQSLPHEPFEMSYFWMVKSYLDQ